MQMTMFDADGNEIGRVEAESVSFENSPETDAANQEKANRINSEIKRLQEPVTLTTRIKTADYDKLTAWLLSIARRDAQRRWLVATGRGWGLS